MTQVFISYSRKDLNFVNQLAADLKNAGLNVWYDVSGIGGGSRWRAEIESALRNSQFVIVVLSPDAISSEWVEREFLFSSNLKRKIIPLMYRPCELPLNYVDLNFIDVAGENYQRNFPELLQAVMVDPAKVPLPKAAAKMAENKKTSFGWKKIAAITGGFILLGVALLLVINSGILISLPFGPTSTATSPPFAVIPPAATIHSGDAEMILIPAGDFTMGSDIKNAFTECKKYRSDCQRRWFEDETPSQVIYQQDFYIDRYEVTNESYAACVKDGACTVPLQNRLNSQTDYYDTSQFTNYPVVFVTWEMANAYCQWRGARLPTEIEWEKAARGTNGNTYPWGNDFIGDNSNFCDADCTTPDSNKDFSDGFQYPAPVESFFQGASQYGIYNMSGNVAEWVDDWYGPYPGGSPTGSDFFSPPQTYRVVRGGSWKNTIDWLRTTNRDPMEPTKPDDHTGFRCGMDAPSQ